MKLRDVMHREVETVAPDTPLREAARRINNARGLRMLPVCDANKVIGVLTMRDLTMRATAEGRDPVASRVREVMTREVVCGYESQDVRDAEGIMRVLRIPHLFVVDRRKHLMGVVSLEELQRNHPRRTPRSKSRKAKQMAGHAHEHSS